MFVSVFKNVCLGTYWDKWGFGSDRWQPGRDRESHQDGDRELRPTHHPGHPFFWLLEVLLNDKRLDQKRNLFAHELTYSFVSVCGRENKLWPQYVVHMWLASTLHLNDSHGVWCGRSDDIDVVDRFRNVHFFDWWLYLNIKKWWSARERALTIENRNRN